MGQRIIFTQNVITTTGYKLDPVSRSRSRHPLHFLLMPLPSRSGRFENDLYREHKCITIAGLQSGDGGAGISFRNKCTPAVQEQLLVCWAALLVTRCPQGVVTRRRSQPAPCSAEPSSRQVPSARRPAVHSAPSSVRPSVCWPSPMIATCTPVNNK